MENHEPKWTEEILESMRGSKRAQPAPTVLANLQQEIADEEAIIVSMRHWQKYAAVALLLLLVNVTALLLSAQQDKPATTDRRGHNPPPIALSHSFQLYD